MPGIPLIFCSSGSVIWFSITSAFAVSSILVIIAIIVLVLRNIFEHRQSDYKKGGQK